MGGDRSNRGRDRAGHVHRLRVGIATARALAQARDLPIAPVGSLAALARGIGESAPDQGRLALIDARRGEVFAALFDSAEEPVLGPEAIGPEALVAACGLGVHPGGGG